MFSNSYCGVFSKVFLVSLFIFIYVACVLSVRSCLSSGCFLRGWKLAFCPFLFVFLIYGFLLMVCIIFFGLQKTWVFRLHQTVIPFLYISAFLYRSARVSHQDLLFARNESSLDFLKDPKLACHKGRSLVNLFLQVAIYNQILFQSC